MPRVLFIGDIVGKPGRNFVKRNLARWREEYDIDLVIANAENSAGGSGVNVRISHELRAAGVDAITLGDHVWDQKGFEREIDGLDFVCRPANLPRQCPGRTHLIIEDKNGFRLAVFTVLGRQYLTIKSDCPFLCAEEMRKSLDVDGVFVEMHAEATSEKIALGWYLDGTVAAVVGTHTHVPTADGRVLPAGTAYLSDAGMTGPYASVLGRSVDAVVNRFLDGMPRRFPVASDDVRLCGCLVDIDPKTGLSQAIRRVEWIEGSSES